MEEINQRAWVVIVCGDDCVTRAILSGGMIRKSVMTGKVLAVTSIAVSLDARCKLEAVFDEVVEAPADSVGNRQERDWLLLHCLNLSQFKKLVIFDAGVLLRDTEMDPFEHDFVIPDYTNKWKVVSLTPSKLLHDRALKFEWGMTSLEEIKARLKIQKGGDNVGAHVVLPLQELKHSPTKGCIPYVEVGEWMLDPSFFTVGKPAISELEEEIMSIMMSLRGPPNPTLNVHRAEKDWIAVVGMSCRFPEANSVEEYWEVLKSGRNTSELPSEYRVALSNMDTRFKVNLLKCGIDEFDASFFGMSPTEAAFTDPQGRILLELSWEAFEDAGLRPDKLRNNPVGIFFGTWLQDYKEMMNQEGKPVEDFIRKYLGNGAGSLSAKLSYFYGFTGPNIATESGCSSSMIAVDLACNSLRRGECPLALAAGANIILQMDTKNKLVWAADGKCKTFDEGGDGYGRGEGVAVLVLKRYTDAVRDGDRIHGVVLGSATSQEGLSRSYGTPTIKSETMAMENALKAAGIAPNNVDYVEAHATGTEVGDPIEAAAIVQAYSSTERQSPLLIASGKTNIGHTESCSGIAAIIKVLLAMKHELIPPHVNLHRLNPKVDFSTIPATIPTHPVEWKRATSGRPRIAGVSNFGITGTDVHMLIKEGPLSTLMRPSLSSKLPSFNILTISAKTEEALRQLITSYADHLQCIPENWEGSEIASFAYTANACRSHHGVRAAVVGRTREELVASLQTLSVKTSSQPPLKICFLFTPSYELMTDEELKFFAVLYDTSPPFKMYMEFCNHICQQTTDTKTSHCGASFLTSKFSSYFSLFKLWQSWGVDAELVLGHKLGNLVAKAAIGDWSLEEAFQQIKNLVVQPVNTELYELETGNCSYVSRASFGEDLEAAEAAASNLGCGTFIHIGFNKIEGALTKNNLKDAESCWLPLVSTLATLYETGIDVDWEKYYEPYPETRNKVSLPRYPFQRKRFWFERKQKGSTEVGFYQSYKKLHPLLGGSLRNASDIHIFQSRFDNQEEISYLDDHIIGTQVIFPGAGFLEMALAASAFQARASPECVSLTDFKIHHPLQFTSNGFESVVMQTLLSKATDNQPGSTSVSMELGPENKRYWKQYASSVVDIPSKSRQKVGQNLGPTLENIKKQCREDIVEDFYGSLAKVGLNYGPHFKPIRRIWRGDNQTLVEVFVPSSAVEKYIIHPTVLDAMLQCLIMHVCPELSALHVPVKIGQFVCQLAAAAKLRESATAFILCDSDVVSLLDNFGNVTAVMVSPELRKTTVKTVLIAAALSRDKVATDDVPTAYEIDWKPSETFQPNNSLDLSNSEDYTDSPAFRSLTTYLESRNRFTIREQQLDEKMDELCNLYVLKAFYEMGWKPESKKDFKKGDLVSQLQIVEPLVPAFNHFFEYLVKMDIFEKMPGNNYLVHSSPLPENQIQACIQELLSIPDVEDYAPLDVVKACGSNLALILQGKLRGQQILFGSEHKDGMNMAEFYYQNSRFYKDGAKGPAKVFEELVTNVWKNGGGMGKKMKILEIGSGTGFFTEDGLTALEKNGIEYDYVFTDISSAFFTRASVKFQDYVENISFKKLDIEKDPLEQGFLPAYFDIVVAVDVLHATKVLANTLKHVEMVTKLGGSLIIGETNKPIKEIDINFGILDGYWQYEDIALRPSHCTITADQWEILFKAAGYSGSVRKINGSDSKTCTVVGKLGQRPPPDMSPFPSQKVWILLHATEGSLKEGNSCTDLIGLMNRIGRHVIAVSFKHFKEQWETLRNQELNLEGVLYLIENVACFEAQSCKMLLEPLLAISQHFLQSGGVCLPKLVVASVGLSWHDFDEGRKCFPSTATLWGFIRSARMEMAGTVSKLIDLDPASEPEARANHLFQEIWVEDDEETEIMYRSDMRLVRRLCEMEKVSSESRSKALVIPESRDGSYSLELPDSKLLEDLSYELTATKAELRDNEVLVDIHCSSLNFRDVLCVMKPTEEFERMTALGLDFSGVIQSAGENANGWKIGDRVFGYTSTGGTVASHVKVKDHVLARIPHRLTFAEAATLPVAFVTAWHCMYNVANMKTGQTILVHAASGGVGLMAIQISKHLGVNVIGTAGSSRKRAYLKSLGVANVYNSRTLEFGKGVKELTSGKGVDVVLNCLTGPGFKETSLGICKEGGWFLEISKLDIWTPAEFSSLKPSVKYQIVDVLAFEPKLQRSIMDTLAELLDGEIIEPIPFIRYSAERVIDALSYLQKAKHIGKLVVEMPKFDFVNERYQYHLFNSQSTYLITGGKGAIGFAIAKWMVLSGAKYIVLLGRSPPKPETYAEIRALNEDGAVITSMEADLSNYEECKRVFQTIERDPTLPQLRGIHHCAGVLSDRMVVQQSWDNFEYVMAPKVSGAYNLHQLSLELPLEFFVLHSSSSSTFGIVGQTNYSAANAFMESLAEMRRWMGLKGMAISWGQWNAGLAENQVVEGYTPMSVEQGIAALERCFLENLASVVVGKINVDQICKLFPAYANTFLKELTNGKNGDDYDESNGGIGGIASEQVNIEEEYKNSLGMEERQALVQRFVTDLVCETLGLESTEFDANTMFGDMGMDSLLSIEFFNKIQYRLKETKLGFVDMVENGTVSKMSEIIGNALNSHLV